MSTDLSIINAALTRTGSEAITSLDDDVIEASIANKNYPVVVLDALSTYPWRWATKTETLALLSDTPASPWSYAYQLPSDAKHLRVVSVNGTPIDYEQQFNKLLCNYGTGATVIAKYIWSAPESYWPPEFAEYVTQRMEVLFLRGVGERYEEASDREKSVARQLSIAKLTDSKRRSPFDPTVSRTLEARSGILTGPYANTVPWR